MAAKKKAAAKPTRTGAETKSWTSASARMQAKGKSGQRSANAAHAGKSGKAGKTAVDSAELRSGLRARNRLTTFGGPKNPPNVFPDRFDQQEEMRNQNKGLAAGIPLGLQSDYRGRSRLNSTTIQTSYGNSPLGSFSRGAAKALMSMVVGLDKLGGKSGRTTPQRAQILGQMAYGYNTGRTNERWPSQFEATGKDNRRTGGGRRGPENVPARTGDFYGRQWSAVDSDVIPGAARGNSTQRAENQRNMAKKPKKGK